MRMPPKLTIGGSGDTGAAKAPEHSVKLETEVAVTANEVSRGQKRDGDDVVLPLPEPEVHSDSGYDSDDDEEPVSHLYPFMWQIYPRGYLVSPASPFWTRNPMVMFSQSMKSELDSIDLCSVLSV
jgi:hypothetical protein